MIVIGFTGTRKGMSDHQKKAVQKIMKWYENKHSINYVVHGGCIGADIDFHTIFEKHHRHVRPGYSSVNPANLSHRGAFPNADIIYLPKPYLVRNKEIVNDCDILIACPFDDIQKGGTWSTIKYAKSMGKPVNIINREL